MIDTITRGMKNNCKMKPLVGGVTCGSASSEMGGLREDSMGGRRDINSF
jgi:hypothetical protein